MKDEIKRYGKSNGYERLDVCVCRHLVRNDARFVVGVGNGEQMKNNYLDDDDKLLSAAKAMFYDDDWRKEYEAALHQISQKLQSDTVMNVESRLTLSNELKELASSLRMSGRWVHCDGCGIQLRGEDRIELVKLTKSPTESRHGYNVPIRKKVGGCCMDCYKNTLQKCFMIDKERESSK